MRRVGRRRARNDRGGCPDEGVSGGDGPRAHVSRQPPQRTQPMLQSISELLPFSPNEMVSLDSLPSSSSIRRTRGRTPRTPRPGDRQRGHRRRQGRHRNVEIDAPVRAATVVVLEIPGRDTLQVPPVPDKRPIQTGNRSAWSPMSVSRFRAAWVTHAPGGRARPRAGHPTAGATQRAGAARRRSAPPRRLSDRCIGRCTDRSRGHWPGRTSVRWGACAPRRPRSCCRPGQ